MSPRWNKRLKPAFFKFVACEMKKINNRFFESLYRKTLVNITRCPPHWHIYILFRFDIMWTNCKSASIAQWQSTGLVNQGSWVQTSLEALWIFFSRLKMCISVSIKRKCYDIFLLKLFVEIFQSKLNALHCKKIRQLSISLF